MSEDKWPYPDGWCKETQVNWPTRKFVDDELEAARRGIATDTSRALDRVNAEIETARLRSVATQRVTSAARAVDALFHPESREGEHWCYTDVMPGPQARFAKLRAALADLDSLNKNAPST